MSLTTTSFNKCSPSYGTDIARCGTVTQCNALPLETGELVATFGTSPNYRIMESLFDYEFEIKQCMVTQSGLAEFLMANKVVKTMGFESVNNGRFMIQPFVLAKQTSVINNAYWNFTGGTLCLVNGTPDPAGTYWYVVATSGTGIPADTHWFNVDERVFLNGLSDAGSQINTQYIVTLATVDGSTVQLVLQPQNTGSFLDAARLANPVMGYLERGTANKSDFERFCAESPGLNTNKLVPFWVETSRMTMCRSELYREYRRRLADNPLYQMFGDIPELELNQQQATDYERRHINTILWGKAISTHQTLADYRNLAEIDIPSGLIVTSGAEIGSCVGRKANAIGFYEQHAECSRVKDLQGAQLNLPALFNSFYLMSRVRQTNNSTAAYEFDVYTDEVTARQIRIAMLAYYSAESQGMLRMTLDIGNMPTGGAAAMTKTQRAPMGFMYSSYTLFFPTGVTMNVIPDRAFDDRVNAASNNNMANTGRYLFVLDWTKNYVAIAASNKVVNTVGNLKDIAPFDDYIACTMKRPTKELTLYSRTYAVVSECPAGDIILSNFSGAVPEAVNANAVPGGNYG